MVKKLPDVERKITKNFTKKILKIGPNGTRKWVVEIKSSHLVFFLYKMGHSTVHLCTSPYYVEVGTLRAMGSL